jgi:hypothetical protein
MNQPAADISGTESGLEPRPPAGSPILSNQEGSFAWSVLAQRHPALIEQVRRAHPYGPRQLAHLDALHEEITTGPITPLPSTAQDHATWEAWAAPENEDGPYFGRSWFDVPFLWAESYFYRRLLDAVDYYGDGPWVAVDPFEPAKSTELAQIGELAVPTSRQDLLRGCLWGNRADLGFRIGLTANSPEAAALRVAHDLHAPGDHPLLTAAGGLLVDHGQQLWKLLASADPGRVIVVVDNAGRELLADLLLIDHLLTSYLAEQVILHLKPAPYYVSDATPADASACLRTLAAAGTQARDAAQRLATAAATGTLVIATHPFYCAPLPFHHLPADLATQLASARLVILKGDLNYRRLVGDTHQPATTPFAEAAGYFPAPVAALRTLKSDVVVGLDPATTARLNATGMPWRTAGTHAVIQLRA